MDIRMLGTVGGLNRFIQATSKVSENVLRGTSKWIDHQTGDVISRVSESQAEATALVTKCQEFELALPNIDTYKQQLLNGDDAAWNAVMPQLQILNSTMTEISSYTRHLVIQLGPISEKFEKSAYQLEKTYAKQLRTWSKHLELQASVTTHKLLSSNMETVTWLRKEVLGSIQEAAEGAQEAEHILRNDVGVPLPHIDDYCVDQVARDVDVFRKTPAQAGSEYVGGLVHNISKGLRTNLNLTAYLRKNMRDVDHEVASVAYLDSNISAMLSAIGKVNVQRAEGGAAGEVSAEAKQALKKTRQASAEVIIASLEQVRPLLLSFKPSLGDETASLLGMLHRVNTTCHQAESYREYIEETAEKAADFPDTLNVHVTDRLFSISRIWPLFRSSILILLVGASTAFMGRFIAQANDHIQPLLDENMDAMKGLCAFYEYATDFDTTMKERATRPLQRSVLRLKFLWKYSRSIVIYLIFLFVAVAFMLTHFAEVVRDACVMYIAASFFGDVCSSDEALGFLSDEDQCAHPFNKISEALDGAQIIPGGSCGAAGLLVCRDFFDPLSSMLFWDVVMKVIAIIGVVVIAFLMPNELRLCFSRQVELYVDKKVVDRNIDLDVLME